MDNIRFSFFYSVGNSPCFIQDRNINDTHRQNFALLSLEQEFAEIAGCLAASDLFPMFIQSIIISKYSIVT